MGLIIQWLVVGQQADFFRIDLSQMLRLPALLVSEITVTGANGNRAGTTQPHVTKVEVTGDPKYLASSFIHGIRELPVTLRE